MGKKIKQLLIVLIGLAFVVSFIFLSLNFLIVGKVVDTAASTNAIGPSAEEQQCMIQCMGCSSPGVGCTGNQEQCTIQCDVEKPETTEETSCMEECVVQGCGEFDFQCQEQNKAECEDECGMKGDAPDESEMSAEQLCISKCVAEVDSTLICGASQEGETGNEVCQRCASDCVNLYEGPCLDDEKLSEKKEACKTCERCYGEPVLGDSGEGWECIVDVECKDASAEFGDEPGIGSDSSEKESSNVVTDVFEGISNFFKGIFN